MLPHTLYTHEQILELVCKTTGKWALCLSSPGDDFTTCQVKQAAPFLSFDECEEVLRDGAVILSDSEDDIWELFEQVVCDGPTKTNPYDGPCRIYATLWSPTEGCINENT